jgi:hypothetical protein
MKSKMLLQKMLFQGIVAGAVIMAALAFAACENPSGGGNSGAAPSNADKISLVSIITEAEAAKAGVWESENGTGVPIGTKWVPSAALTVFNSAINTAKGVRDNASVDQTQVNGAVATLRAAIDVFNAAVTTKQTSVDVTALAAKITEAGNAKNSVIVAADASGAAEGLSWATQAQVDTLQAAINAATDAKNAMTDQSTVDAAVSTLNNAIISFSSTVSSNGVGTKTSGFSQAEFDALKASATTAKTGAVVAESDDDAPPAVYWVTQTVMDALESAITTASSATLSDDAYKALLSALQTFNAAKKLGSMPDKASLQTAIQSADSARANVVTATSANEVPKGLSWVTTSEWNALDTPYNAAVTAFNNTNATKNAVAQATSALNGAVGTFNSAKSTNGPGTAESKLTITGLESVYKDGTAVQVGAAVNPTANPSFGPVKGTITSGSLTVSLEGLANGTYYTGFSSDGIIFFISTGTTAFGGVPVNKTRTDFQLVTHSINFGEMGLPQSMTLDSAMQAGMQTDYSSFKTGVTQLLTNGGHYTDLNFLPIGLYKDEACTQEYSGGETVGPTTTAYTKFSLQAIMESVMGTVGHITGSVNFSNGPEGAVVTFEAYTTNPDNSETHVREGPNLGNGESFSLPFTEEFLEALNSKTGLYVRLWVRPSTSDNRYYKEIKISSANLSGDGKNTLNMSTLNFGSLSYFTISGSLSVAYEGALANVRISVHEREKGGGDHQRINPSDTQWSLHLPYFDTDTSINIGMRGYDSDGNELFDDGWSTTATVKSSDKSGVAMPYPKN